MGKSSRAYGSREIKGQRREVLESTEAQFESEAELRRQAALDKAAAAPPVPVVNKGPVRVVQQRTAMEVDTDGRADAAGGGGDDELGPAEARLRRVMGSVTGYAIKKPRQQLKKAAMAQFGGVHGGVHGPGKRRLAAMKKAIKRMPSGGAR